MRFIIIIISSFWILCSEKSSKSNPEIELSQAPSSPIQDTSFIIRDVSKTTIGNAYYSQAIEYIPTVKNDTLNLSITINKLLKDSSLFIDMRERTVFDTNTINFEARVIILEKTLNLAKRDFNIKKVRSIYLGGLSSDAMKSINIKLSNEYLKLYKPQKNISVKDYAQLSEFLLKSDIAKLLNQHIAFTELKVEKFSIEKAGLIPKESYSKWPTFQNSEEELPKYLLMALVWVRLSP